MADWEGQCKEKDAEIADLKSQLEIARGDKEVKTFSKDLKILDQCILEAADLEKQKADKLRDLEGKAELSEEEINQKMNQVMPIYEFDSETLQLLVLEVATFKNQKNREIEDLKNEVAKAASGSQEAADGDKKVSFTPEKTEEGEDGENNQSADFKVSPMEDSDYYLSDSSKIIRNEDLGNTDVVLSTLVKEIQDIKAKVTLIERSVLSTDAVRVPTSSSFYMSPSYGHRRIPEVSSSKNDESNTSEALYLPQKEEYRDAFLQKSLQLENLQRELAAIKGDTLRFASKQNNYQLSCNTPFPRRAYTTSTQAWVNKARTQTGVTTSIPRGSGMNNQKSILKGNSGGDSRPAMNSGGSAYLNWREVSDFEERTSSQASSNDSPSSGKDDSLPNDAELMRDAQLRYQKRYGKKDLGELKPEEEYEGRIRDSDDFDWMKGVTNPPMGLSKETLDRGNKYLRKLAKKYDKEHPNDKSCPRYGMEEDHDLDMIERALRENFVETEHGLEYRLPRHQYY